jgi:hypothetical protein
MNKCPYGSRLVLSPSQGEREELEVEEMLFPPNGEEFVGETQDEQAGIAEDQEAQLLVDTQAEPTPDEKRKSYLENCDAYYQVRADVNMRVKKMQRMNAKLEGEHKEILADQEKLDRRKQLFSQEIAKRDEDMKVLEDRKQDLTRRQEVLQENLKQASLE